MECDLEFGISGQFDLGEWGIGIWGTGDVGISGFLAIYIQGSGDLRHPNP